MNKNAPFYLFFLTLFLFSCRTYRYPYAVEPANCPVFTEKGESQVSASIFANKFIPTDNHFSNGVNVQAAYAISNHLAVTYSHNYKIEKDVNRGEDYSYFDSSSTVYKRRSNELGAGGFFFLDRKKKLQLAVYGGYGWGRLTITDNVMNNNLKSTRVLSANTNRFYLQPSFAFVFKNLSLAFVVKASYVNYRSMKTDYTNDELMYYEMYDLQHTPSMHFEPSINLQGKLLKSKCLLLNAGGGISFSDSDQSSRWRCLYLGIGIDPIKLLRGKK